MKTEKPEPLLSDDEFRRLDRLSLFVSRRMGGRGAGEQGSPRMGRGIEFAGYRDYQPGDDLRYLDWNLYARLDRLYLKRFVEEGETTIHLLLDVSRSMALGNPSKLTTARKLCAALAYLGIRRHHRVGIGVFSEGLQEEIPPRRGEGHLVLLFRLLERVPSSGTTDLTRSLGGYAERKFGPGWVVLLSDLLAPGGYEEGVRRLLSRRHRVGILQVLAPEDRSPLLQGACRLRDMETGVERWVDDGAAAVKGYRDRWEAFQDVLDRFCRGREVFCFQAPSSHPMDRVLLDFLSGYRRSGAWRF
ncbi:MAG: DUF58 domain-containing protein [Nitrospirae bacterium]|nr:DUF58 domain-containing protein [Nitrospirota bacterium]